MSRRPLLLAALVVVALAAGVWVSTLATLDEARPDGPCPDRRWGCAEFEPDENVLLGVLLPTTGPLADRGSAELAAIVTTMGKLTPRVFGRPIEVVHRDDACSFEEAAAAARYFATSKSPTRPPTAVVLGGICRETAQPAAQILADSGVPLVSWYGDDLGFAEPGPRLFFLVRTPPAPDAAESAARIAVDAIRDVAIRGPDGTIYVPRTALRDAIRQEARSRLGSLATP